MPAATLAKVAIVIGSTRTPRVGPKVAEWVKSVIDRRSENGDTIYELVDVAEFKLPVFDEPILPAMVPAQGTFSAFSLLLLRCSYALRAKRR
jgi:NAD(P)H-dependent FMN reductase